MVHVCACVLDRYDLKYYSLAYADLVFIVIYVFPFVPGKERNLHLQKQLKLALKHLYLKKLFWHGNRYVALKRNTLKNKTQTLKIIPLYSALRRCESGSS